jgi:DNA-binding NtrC family response regulator
MVKLKIKQILILLFLFPNVFFETGVLLTLYLYSLLPHVTSFIMANIEKRNLIIFQSIDYEIEPYDALAEADWQVHIATTIQQVSALLAKHTFLVGLCLVDKCTLSACNNDICCRSEQYSKLNRLFKLHSNINWIMGLPKEASPKINTKSIEAQLISEYCTDYITLPIDTKQLLFALGHAYGMNALSQPFRGPTKEHELNFGIIGSSPAMSKLFNLLGKVAKEDCAVLIQGETGTGKELIANAIHNNSIRSEEPLITINCGAFPKDLIQAELFGYEKGAYTGAHQRYIGRIESAQNGTLFLDEVGDLPLAQQINLLRFLEDRTIQRIGSSVKIPINVRIIAATHVDLKAAVERNEFREDLYYRLQVLKIETPPLRERLGDIEMLAWYFFNKASANQTYKAKGFQLETLGLINCFAWPGNVRQLMNTVRNAVVISENVMLTPEDLGLERPSGYFTLQTLDEARSNVDRDLILNTLRHTNNNISHAAKIMGISRVSLYRLIDKHTVMVDC